MTHIKARFRLAAVADIHCTRKTVDHHQKTIVGHGKWRPILYLPGGDLKEVSRASRAPAINLIGVNKAPASKGQSERRQPAQKRLAKKP